MDKTKLKATIEHTLLKPTATAQEIEKLCQEALENHFFGVCLHSVWLPLAAQILANSPVKIVSVAGFPLGANATAVKCYEVEYAFSQGAHEVDFVINLGWVKESNHRALKEEFDALVKAAHRKPLKVILETCLLTSEEKQKACTLAIDSDIAFVKTSTGFASGGATVDDIRLMRKAVDGKAGVKASGGIRDLETALAMLHAGADRLGTSSGVKIVSK